MRQSHLLNPLAADPLDRDQDAYYQRARVSSLVEEAGLEILGRAKDVSMPEIMLGPTVSR